MTTYYVSQVDGNDSYNGQYATWEGGLNGPWLTIAKADDLSGDQSDNSVLFNRGGTWRERWSFACVGTSGHHFIVGAYGTGAKPKILGSNQISTWEVYSGSIYRASLGTAPGGGNDHGPVWFIKASDGKTHWGAEKTTIVGCTAEYDWHWESSYLYCYSPDGDPDSVYTSVEAATRKMGIQGTYDRSYITINDLEVAFTSESAVGSVHQLAQYWTIDGCTIHHAGIVAGRSGYGGLSSGTYGEDAVGWEVRNNLVYECGSHGIHIFANYESYNWIIEDNEVYNCYHTGIDVKASNSTSAHDGIIRRNLVYSTSDFYATDQIMNGYFHRGENSGATSVYDVVYSYNLALNMFGCGFSADDRTTGIEYYNCVAYGTNPLYSGGWSVGFAIQADSVDPTHITIKNCISMNMKTACLWYDASASSVFDAIDYNCWYQSGGGTAIYVYGVSTAYHYDDFSAYKTAIQASIPGAEAHSFWEDPKFVNAGGTTAEDYKLASNSPLINEGVDVSLTEDYWGTSIPQGAAPDIGAHEYVMGVASNYLENEILDHVFKVGSYSVPTNLYVALCKSTIEDSDTGSTLPSEISVGSYARKRCNTWTTASGGALSNNMAIAFVEATANWGTITDFAVTDSGSGGNMLVYGKLLYPKRVLLGDVFRFATNDLDIGLD